MEPMILTSVITVLGVFIANAALLISLFLWNRAEAREDMWHRDLWLESTKELVRAIYDEGKSFHSRLCAIEERNKK